VDLLVFPGGQDGRGRHLPQHRPVGPPALRGGLRRRAAAEAGPPAALSLRYPNETTPADKLIRSLFKDFLLFDNAYALLTPAPGTQVNFNRMPAHMVEIRGASMFQAEGYRFHLRDGTFVDFQPEQVLHWSGENPDDPRMGVSKLDTLRSVIAEDAALQAAIIELANAGLTEPVWAYRPLDAPLMSNEAEEGLSEHLTNRVHGRNKRVIVTQEGTELRSFGVTPKDAQMMEVRRWAIEQVAREFGVPLGMVGLSDNLAEAQSQFYADTLPPYCEEFTKMLNHRVLVRVYNWTKGCFEFNLDEKHMGDDRLAALVSATGRPVMLTDEARARLNLPPVDGGDELVTPMNVIVGEKPSVDVMPIQDPNGPPQDGSYREQPPKALTKAEDYTPLPQLHPGRKGDLDRQQRNVDLAKATIERHYNRLERSLGAKSRRAVPRHPSRTGSDGTRSSPPTWPARSRRSSRRKATSTRSSSPASSTCARSRTTSTRWPKVPRRRSTPRSAARSTISA
jgi:HK97 family phage portal protein